MLCQELCLCYVMFTYVHVLMYTVCIYTNVSNRANLFIDKKKLSLILNKCFTLCSYISQTTSVFSTEKYVIPSNNNTTVQ